MYSFIPRAHTTCKTLKHTREDTTAVIVLMKRKTKSKSLIKSAGRIIYKILRLSWEVWPPHDWITALQDHNHNLLRTLPAQGQEEKKNQHYHTFHHLVPSVKLKIRKEKKKKRKWNPPLVLWMLIYDKTFSRLRITVHRIENNKW